VRKVGKSESEWLRKRCVLTEGEKEAEKWVKKGPGGVIW